MYFSPFRSVVFGPDQGYKASDPVVTVLRFSLGEEGSPGSVLEAGPCLLFLEGHVPGSGRAARVNRGLQHLGAACVWCGPGAESLASQWPGVCGGPPVPWVLESSVF